MTKVASHCSVIKNLPASAGDTEMWVRSLGFLSEGGNDNSTPAFLPGNPQRATVHGVTKSGT